jgi:hypothetical protein
MDDDAKVNRGASRYACYQYGELRHLMPHSTEQMGHRAEAYPDKPL